VVTDVGSSNLYIPIKMQSHLGSYRWVAGFNPTRVTSKRYLSRKRPIISEIMGLFDLSRCNLRADGVDKIYAIDGVDKIFSLAGKLELIGSIDILIVNH